MADPRGLSGAVYQQTPVRDFTKDLLLRKQLGAEQAAKQQSSTEDFLAENNVAMSKDLPAQYVPAYLDALDRYKVQAEEMAMLRSSNKSEYQKRLPAFKNTKNGLISLVSAAKMKQAVGEANFSALNKNRDKYTDENIKEIEANVNETFNFNGEFTTGEDGSIMVGNQTASEALASQRFNAPEEEAIDPIDGILNREEVDVQNWGIQNADGSYSFSSTKAVKFFNEEIRNQSDYYIDILKRIIKEDDGRTHTTERALELAAENPEYNQEASQYFSTAASNRFKEGGARAGDGNSSGGDYNSSKQNTFKDTDGKLFKLSTITFPKDTLPVNLEVAKEGNGKIKEKIDVKAFVNEFTAQPDGSLLIRFTSKQNDETKTQERLVRKNDPLYNSLIASLKKNNYDIDNPEFFINNRPEALERGEDLKGAVDSRQATDEELINKYLN